MITFDDGESGIYNNALPLFIQRGIPATIYVVTDLIDTVGMLTQAQLTTMHDFGWIIGNHTKNHSAGANQAEAEAAFGDAAAILDGWGFSDGSHHGSYPDGLHPQYVLDAVAAIDMSTVRCSHAGAFQLPIVGGYHQLTFQPTSGANDAEQLLSAKGFIDSAKTNKAICIFLFHNITEKNPVFLAGVLDYIIEQQVIPLTIKDLYGAVSGPITVVRPW